MSAETKLRIAVIGVGGIGKTHLKQIALNPKIELVAVCDIVEARAAQVGKEKSVKFYTDYQDLLKSEKLDAITIGTPHYDHMPIAEAAFAVGVHVLTEKPMAVTTSDAVKALKAYEEAKKNFPKLVFAIMFQERTIPHYKKMKELLEAGVLGKLTRTHWIATTWYRTQAYYNTGDWRATWKGEGGGLLINQCPHTLDMYQYLVGVPNEVTAHLSLGKYHSIEVEDEASAHFEHENGMVGHFHATTGECPGTNRLEIVGELGKLVYEENKLKLYQNEMSMFRHLKEATSGFELVKHQVREIEIDQSQPQGHGVILDNFADAIKQQVPLIAPGEEGLKSLSISNAMMLSSFSKKTVSLPLDGVSFENYLKTLSSNSKFKKTVSNTAVVMDFTDSWKK